MCCAVDRTLGVEEWELGSWGEIQTVGKQFLLKVSLICRAYAMPGQRNRNRSRAVTDLGTKMKWDRKNRDVETWGKLK